MKEVLTEKDFAKADVIKYLEEYGSITPDKAAIESGKSSATVRRYLKMLVNTGYIEADGRTNNIHYKVVDPQK